MADLDPQEDSSHPAFSPGENGWVDVASANEVVEGGVIQVIQDGTPIALYRLDNGIYASQDICTHEFAFMSQGYIEDGCIECPLHQALFCIRTGEVREGPATRALKTYPTHVEAGRVHIKYDGPPEDE